MNAFSDQLTLWAVNVLIHTTVLTALLLLIAMSFRKRAALRYWIVCCGLLLVLGSPAISAVIQSRGSSLLALAVPTSNQKSQDANAAPLVALTKPVPHLELSNTPGLVTESGIQPSRETAFLPELSDGPRGWTWSVPQWKRPNPRLNQSKSLAHSCSGSAAACPWSY